jgi:hypothetical protein
MHACATIAPICSVCRCLDLPKLIEVKRAAGRPKDLEVIAELEALLEERDRWSSVRPAGQVGFAPTGPDPAARLRRYTKLPLQW